MFKVLTCLFPTCPQADLSSPKNMFCILVERLPQEHRGFLSRKVSEQKLMQCSGMAGSHYRVGVRKHVRPLVGLAVGAWAQTRLCPNSMVPSLGRHTVLGLCLSLMSQKRMRTSSVVFKLV